LPREPTLVDRETLSLANNDRAFNNVTQFANVTGPGIRLKQIQRLFAYIPDVLACFPGITIDEVLDQQRNVFLSLLQWRNLNRKNVEAVEKILAELAGSYSGWQVTVYAGITLRVDCSCASSNGGVVSTVKLSQHDPAAAVEILRGTLKYDLSNAPGLNSLYPAYIRGLAYLQLRQGRMAAVEFQKLLDHPGIVGTEMTGPLARLQLGRAYEIMGDHATARRWYEEFLTIWKDADSDLPVYREAKAEYARLEKETPTN